MTAKEWLKSQLGVWQFNYEARDIRDKSAHPATFPIPLAKKVIELFTHKGELVLDPFVCSGTTLVAAKDIKRNAVGFDLQQKYIEIPSPNSEPNTCRRINRIRKNGYVKLVKGNRAQRVPICQCDISVIVLFGNETI